MRLTAFLLLAPTVQFCRLIDAVAVQSALNARRNWVSHAGVLADAKAWRLRCLWACGSCATAAAMPRVAICVGHLSVPRHLPVDV